MPLEPTLIIIADDDPDDSLFLLTVLLSMPFEFTIITVPNGDRLINILEFVSPQFIFLDINMPKKNGFEALKHIRSNKRSAHSRVIMCSTSSSANDVRMSQELGADMYVTKPRSIQNYNRVIEDIFKMDWASKANKRIPESLLLSHAQ